MVKAADGTIKLDVRDVMKHPLGWLLIALATAGGGTGAVSVFGLATKSDLQEINQRLVAIEKKVDELAIETGINKRLREMQANAKGAP